MKDYEKLRTRTDLSNTWLQAGEDSDGHPVYRSPAVQTALSEGMITELDIARALLDFSVGSACVCRDRDGEACPGSAVSFFPSRLGEDPSDGALMVSARDGKVWLSFLFETIPQNP